MLKCVDFSYEKNGKREKDGVQKKNEEMKANVQIMWVWKFNIVKYLTFRALI